MDSNHSDTDSGDEAPLDRQRVDDSNKVQSSGKF